MNYAELKTYLRQLINRSDITDALVAQFITQSQVRIERRLRVSGMEHYVTFNLDGTTGDFRVPTDYIELIDLYTDARKIERVNTATYLKTFAALGVPGVFVQTGHNFRMRPLPSAATVIYLTYYRTQPKLVADLDYNLWSVAAVDCLTYGAAELAGDYFEDERLQRYATKFEGCLIELEEQQNREDASGSMRIQPAYAYPNEDF